MSSVAAEAGAAHALKRATTSRPKRSFSILYPPRSREKCTDGRIPSVGTAPAGPSLARKSHPDQSTAIVEQGTFRRRNMITSFLPQGALILKRTDMCERLHRARNAFWGRARMI